MSNLCMFDYGLSLDLPLQGRQSDSGACRAINSIMLLCQPSATLQQPCMAPHLTLDSRRMLARSSCRQISSRQVALRSMMCLDPTAVGSSCPLLALKVSWQGHAIFGEVSAVVQ